LKNCQINALLLKGLQIFTKICKVKSFFISVGKLTHPNARQTYVAADSDRRLAIARRRSSPLNLAFDARTIEEEENQKTNIG